MRGAWLRRGQANVVSVTILAAATLVMSLLLYSYYSSMYSSLSGQSQMEIIRLAHLSGVGVSNVYSWKNPSGQGGPACYVVKLVNNGDHPIVVRYTLLSLQLQPNLVAATNLTLRVPVDIAAGKRTVYVFTLEDVDGNGLVELVDASNRVLYNGIPSCQDLTGILASSIPPSRYVPSDSIMLTEELTLASLVGNGVGVPVWEIQLPVGGTRHILVLVNVDVPLGNLDFTLLAVVNQKYLVAKTAELP